MIEQLLLDTEKLSKTPKLSIKGENFLLSLLKDSKNPTDILKSLHINKEDLKEILKNLPKEKQKEFKDILKKLDFENIKEPHQNSDTKTEPITIESLLNQIPIKNETKTTTKTEIKIPKKIETKVVEIIKKEIDTKIKTKKIIVTNQEASKFKEIKTLKELITFANKKGLNIQKIAYSKQVKPKIQEVLNEMDNKEIKTPPPKIILSQKTDKKIELNNPPKTAQNNISIEKLLKPTPKNIKKEIKEVKGAKNIQTHEIKPEHKIKLTNHDLVKEIFEEKPKQKIKTDNQSEIISQPIQHEIKHNILKAKQSLKHFASNLQEAIKDYKPPIHKLSIELNPKELGKVEVTLTQRGENLQIQINSNQTSTINFFNAHQNELKTILVNMGYSEVNMSFNSNQQQQQKQQYKQNQQNFSREAHEEDGFVIEIPYRYA